MIGRLLEPEIKALIESKDFGALREAFREWSVADLAELIHDLPEEDQVVVFRLLPHHLATKTFEFLDVDAQRQLLHGMGQEQCTHILNEMSPDDRTAMLEELPPNVVTQLLKLLSPAERTVAQTLLNYPEGSVGRLMTPEYIAVHDDWTVQEVLDYVRDNGQDSETLNVIYVVDEQGKLIDDVRIREFLLRPLDAKVQDIRHPPHVSLKVTDDQKMAVTTFRKYSRTALPVVDSEGYLVGIVTVDDVLAVAEQEATAEIQKFGGLEALDEPYMDIGMFQMVGKRATWLVILFVGEMLTATAMGFFENEIAKAVVLALFVPLIISSGGNSGSQAATLIIRAMALGEVTLKDWWNVMRREILAGFSLGVVLGTLGFCRIALWQTFHWYDYGEHWALVAATVGCSLIGIVLWGSLSGSMLPFVLRKFGVDPATSSAPFVATLVDVTGLIIYFLVAALILHGTLL
jgi:magnesium transporter